MNQQEMETTDVSDMTKTLELGLDTFGDVSADAQGELLPHAQVLRNLVEQAKLADRVGLDYFGIGEHHRVDFAVSAPEVLLAAIAAQTERIHLGTAVTVLSSDDPIRVFQRFATLDAVSNGRAEVILGRGSRSSSRRSCSCSPRCASRSPSPGRATRARPSRTSRCTRRSRTAS